MLSSSSAGGGEFRQVAFDAGGTLDSSSRKWRFFSINLSKNSGDWCSGLLVPDTEMGGKFTTLAEALHDKIASYSITNVTLPGKTMRLPALALLLLIDCPNVLQ